MTPGLKSRIPNILTVGRILSIPVLVAGSLVTSTGTATALVAFGTIVLFVLACITDFLDGYWARKWNLTSDFGRMIDPIADKLLVAACLIAIAIAYGGAWYILVPAMAVIGRDILVSGAREHAALKSRAMPPTKLAKWKTACEMLAIALFILSMVLKTGDAPIESAATIFLWLAAALSVYTGSLYFRASLKA